MDTFENLIQSRPMNAHSAKSFADAVAQCDFAETKYDGMRLTVARDKTGTNHLYSRTLRDQNGKLPHLDEAINRLPAGTILDGEAVLLDKSRREVVLDDRNGVGVPMILPDFNSTMKIMGAGVEKAVERQKENPISIVLFDIPFFAGNDLTQTPLMERREYLEELVEQLAHPQIILSPVLALTIKNLEIMFAAGGEGLMAKNSKSLYYGGARTLDWQKLKAVVSSEAVIMGFSEGEGKYAALFGALEYGQYVDGELVYRGKCPGMTDEVRKDMHANPDKYLGKVIEIAHMGIAKDGYRHPRFKAIREDKLATECVWETEVAGGIKLAVSDATPSPSKKVKKPGTTKTAARKSKKTAKAAGGGVNKLGLKADDALVASEYARCENASSNKYYRVYISKDAQGDYVAWAAYGRWDSDINAPGSEQVTAIPCKGTDLSDYKNAANKKLGSKLAKGYRGELLS